MKSFEDTIDALTDVQRAFIAASLDAFERTLPEDESVIIEDLDDGALAWLIEQADALAEPTIESAEAAGAEAARRMYLARTGNRNLPHTQRTLLRVHGVPEQCCGEPMMLTNGTPCCRCTLDRFRVLYGKACQWDPRVEVVT